MSITTTTLQTLFGSPYQRSAWLEMLGTLLPTKQFATPFFRENSTVAHFYQLGSIDLADEKKLGVYEIKTQPETQLQRNRVQMRQLVAKECRNSDYDGALAVYYDDKKRWRFSFISMEYKLDEQGQLYRSESAPKRYTYLLGEGAQIRTAVQRFSKLSQQTTLQDLIDAFAVAQLNKEFYQKLFEWYEDAKTRVVFPNDLQVEEDDHKSTSLIRLLTRLLFVWFIKEKQLINADLFAEEKVRELIHWDKDSSYYKAVLQNLFFATLNQEITERTFRRDPPDGSNYLVTNVYRYQNLFLQQDKEAILQRFQQTPFLNGGLFECLDREATEVEKKDYDQKKIRRINRSAIRIDGFSDKGNNPLRVPNALFFNDDEKGLINLLAQYQFTVEESTSLDVDVALDPELLGLVFENLLASYNPETQQTARKASGSYYTPREIVNYMVDESLRAYFAQATDIASHKINRLFKVTGAENKLTEHETIAFIQAIDRIKIIDPAVGSGAFPMGILQRLVQILGMVDPENNQWKQRQTDIVSQLDDPESREQALEDIENIFSRENRFNDFGRKLYLIQNSIFGVDIQPIACQIAKLRFFICLAIEQQTTGDVSSNYGIKPLPNLETRFIAADTLRGLDIPKQMTLGYDVIAPLRDKLKRIRERYFSARTRPTKLKLIQEDDATRVELARALEQLLDFPHDDAQRIAEWRPYDHNAGADWFDFGYMFGIADGFDGVIGNPPYVQLQKDGGRLGRLYQACQFDSFTRTGDIYCLFYERALKLLKEGGHVCFITSNKWMRAAYGKNLRDHFIARTQPVQLLDMGADVFEATVDTNILLLRNVKPAGESFRAVTVRADLNRTNGDMARYLNHHGVTMTLPGKGEPWTILSPAELALKQKIEHVGKPLKEWNINIYRGFTTGCNEAFIIDNQTKKRLIREDPKSAELIKPVLRGRDIGRYQANWADLWLIDTHNGYEDVPQVNVDKYKAIKRHLDQFYPQLEKRQDKGVTPYNLRSCAYHSEFEKEKIVFQEMVQKSSFTYDNTNEFYCLDTGRIITGESIKFICSILNSELFFYSIKNYYGGGALGDKGIRMKHTFFESFPVPQIPKTEQKPFTNLVDQILTAKHADPDAHTSTLEAEIDQLVYELYELTSEEISMVARS